MMNPRIVELLANPQLLVENDLNLIQSEIAVKPYIQSLRAVYLLGIHRFQPENYNQILSETAAFTTDKKILYQFINGKEVQELLQPLEKSDFSSTNNDFEKEEIAVDKLLEKENLGFKEEENLSEKSLEIIEDSELQEEKTISYEEIQPVEIEAPKEVFVEGSLNRILFEGEENFLNEESPKIDLEQTIESGKIVVERNFETALVESNPDIPLHRETEIIEDHNTESSGVEVSIEEDMDVVSPEIQEEKTSLQKEKDINFHQTTHFLPEIKIEAKHDEKVMNEPPKPMINKHEEEMQKLIAEVERKMKEKKSVKQHKIEEEKVEHPQQVSFAETQEFEVGKKARLEKKTDQIVDIEDKKNISTEASKTGSQTENVQAEIQEKPKVQSHWKPLDIQQSSLDSFISTDNTSVPEKEEQEPKQKNEDKKAVAEEKIPVMNVSFFSDQIKTIEKQEEKEAETSEKMETESNVPQFINTWQSWLKIERKEIKEEKTAGDISELKSHDEEKPEANVEKKSKAIETFIENEPKISKLKDESDYVIKDKGDDISHLMTETLANIYAEQKLYSKAVKAFELLKEKHPEKKEHFDNRIQEIKEQRSN